MKRLKYGFRTDFSHQTNSTGVTETEDLKLPRKLPQKSLDPLDPRRSLATTVCRPTSPTSLFFLGFGSIAVPPRSLPTVPEHRKLVGPLGLEPRTKGFTLPRRFRREWTISSPQRGAGRSSLSLSALQRSGSLCTFRRCTAGLAQGCQQHALLRFP